MINFENNGVARFPVRSEHITVRAIRLNTVTDDTDTLVTESECNLFKGCAQELFGQIFILTDHSTEKSTVYIIPTPDYALPSIKVEDKTVIINTFGYPVSIGQSAVGDAECLVRDWYRMHYRAENLIAMSNTWGDRNGRTRVNEDFIKKEIDSGADIGLDVVQIDDGWQKGIPNTYDEEGVRVFEGDFWQVKDEVFPRGLSPLSAYAKERGVELGLWFAPHSRGCFEHFERDVSVLRSAYRDFQFKFFKLDMLSLPSEEYSSRMLDFLDEVLSFGEDVSVELDVTADKRLGYLASAPYGTIFVENRYTAWANYYPHRTLRNLWSLSRFVPASKLQFELVNTELYTDKYSDSDELRPALYGIDYLFASVMISNPLFWMETQFLSDGCRERLKAIVPIWKSYRNELAECDVYPIGEKPSGRALTGFAADHGDTSHLLVFREVTDRDSFTFTLRDEYGSGELVVSDAPVDFELNGNTVKVKFENKRSYAWIKLRKK